MILYGVATILSHVGKKVESGWHTGVHKCLFSDSLLMFNSDQIGLVDVFLFGRGEKLERRKQIYLGVDHILNSVGFTLNYYDWTQGFWGPSFSGDRRRIVAKGLR